jgi:thymidylate kinase
MALILLEGLDRTGKTTVAKYYESIGYEVIHLSAPPKGISADDYIQQMSEILSSAAARDLVLDRTHYGELVWPEVYGRKPILGEDEIDILKEIEESVGVHRVMMHDPDAEAHWKRCVANKEPLTKAQFARARSIYSQMAHKYKFELVTLPQFLKKFPDAAQFDTATQQDNSTTVIDLVNESEDHSAVNSTTEAKYPSKTAEQLKLEKANAINDVLSKRILKSKGKVYDDIENDLRNFLNSKLANLLGTNSPDISLSNDEIKFFKTLYRKALKGE